LIKSSTKKLHLEVIGKITLHNERIIILMPDKYNWQKKEIGENFQIIRLGGAYHSIHGGVKESSFVR